MSMSISSNVGTLSMLRNILDNQKETQSTLAKLSSGKRINSAADDAAGLAIAVDMVSQLGSTNQAVDNAGDALGLADTADAALDDSTDILSRLDELAMQAGSGALNASDRADIQTETDALSSELDRIAGSTELNGTSLLAARASLTYQVGAGNVPANDRITVNTVDATAGALGVGGVSLATQSSAAGALDSIASALQQVSSARATLGAEANRASSAIDTGTQSAISLAAAASSIQDADIAQQASDLGRELILGQAGAAVLAQSNQAPATALRLLGAG